MARPLRLEFPGALYHVTSRGNARQKIFLDAEDRHLFLDLFGKEVAQQGWRCYAYCLMDKYWVSEMRIAFPTAFNRVLNGDGFQLQRRAALQARTLVRIGG